MQRLAVLGALVAGLCLAGAASALVLSGGGGGGGGGQTALVIQEQDGTPTGTFSTLKVSNTTLTNNGDGSASLATGLFLSVKDYGATGDGTTSDTAAIQAAIAAAPDGSVIFFPSGTYVIDAVQVLARHGLTFLGTGPRSILKRKGPGGSSGDTAPMLYFAGTENTDITVQHLAFDLNGCVSFCGGIKLAQVTRFWLLDNYLYDSAINNSTANDKFGILTVGSGNGVPANGFIMRNVLDDLQMEVDNLSFVTIAHNIVRRGRVTACIGIFSQGGETLALTQNVTITHNRLEDCDVNGGAIVVDIDPPTKTNYTYRNIAILDNQIVYGPIDPPADGRRGMLIGTPSVVTATSGIVFEKFQIARNYFYYDPAYDARPHPIEMLSSTTAGFVFDGFQILDNVVVLPTLVATTDAIAIRFITNSLIARNIVHNLKVSTSSGLGFSVISNSIVRDNIVYGETGTRAVVFNNSPTPAANVIAENNRAFGMLPVYTVQNNDASSLVMDGYRSVTQTLTAGSTVDANSCRGTKPITAASPVTTDTINTFTDPTTIPAGCQMNVCNTGANAITLDSNTLFKTANSLDVVLAQHACVAVVNTSSFWYQLTTPPGVVVRTNVGNTWSTGTQNMTAATAFLVPVGAGLTTGTNGMIGYDSTANMLHAAQSGGDAKIPQFTITPTNDHCAKWVVSGSTIKLGSSGGACGGTGEGSVTLPLDLTEGVDSGAAPPTMVIEAGAHTALSASTERFDVQWDSSRTVTWDTGVLTTQRFHVWEAPTIAFAGASTVTNTCVVCVTGPPEQGANATLMNTHGILVQAGPAGSATLASGLTVYTPTGATTNHAAQFLGAGAVVLDGAGGGLLLGTPSNGVRVTYGSNGVANIRNAANSGNGTLNANAFIASTGTSSVVGTQVVLASSGGTSSSPASGSMRGQGASGTNTNAGTLTLTSSLGTGTGSIGTWLIQSSVAKQASGSSAHTPTTVLTIGHTQATHPGAAGGILDAPAVTWTDENTAGSGTAATFGAYAFGQPTLAARNGAVTTTEAATVYFANAPTAGSNMTLTRALALNVAAGNVAIGTLKTTGSAGGKRVVCFDPATGILYGSSTGTDCSN